MGISLKNNTRRLTFYLKKVSFLAFNPQRSFREKFLTVVKLMYRNTKRLKTLRISFNKPQEKLQFAGWGMTSKHLPPWKAEGNTDLLATRFAATNEYLLKILCDSQFFLSQFQKDNRYQQEPESILSYLSWRHFIVFWSATFSVKSTNQKQINIVEAGVCDGLTAFFALSAIHQRIAEISGLEAFLYDAWESMTPDLLTEAEAKQAGDYSYLQISRTKLNLKMFSDSASYLQGRIPEVFNNHPGPTELSWLHIDLNSSMPTLKTLEHFEPKLLPGGVILFDDYGWGGYEETKITVDQYCKQSNGLLFPLPTGQAIFFKH